MRRTRYGCSALGMWRGQVTSGRGRPRRGSSTRALSLQRVARSQSLLSSSGLGAQPDIMPRPHTETVPRCVALRSAT